MQSRIVIVVIALVSFLLYYYQAYHLPRSNFQTLMIVVALLFLAYELLYKKLKAEWLRWGIALGILFRVLLLFSFPNLSDDVYRFFWDGNLSSEYVSPFMELPTNSIEGSNSQQLFEKLNSPDYYSVYPPVCQSVFFLAAKVFPANHAGRVFIFKLFLLLCELGSIFLIVKLLGIFSLPPSNVLLYALNPLAIIEVVGNIHFEGAMLFFVLAAIYLLVSQRWVASAVALSLAVSAKLLPLMFLPFLWKKLPFPKYVAYCFLVLGLSILFFLPFCPLNYLPNLFQSIQLYFAKFEFNGSLYYIVRQIGFYTRGYNVLFLVGKYFTLATFLGVCLYAFFGRSKDKSVLPQNFLFALLIYFLFSTIVHPWYIVPLVAFSCFVHYRFALLWSFAIFLSYFAYSNPAYMESLKIIGLEYALVLGYLLFELLIKKRPTLIV